MGSKPNFSMSLPPWAKYHQPGWEALFHWHSGPQYPGLSAPLHRVSNVQGHPCRRRTLMNQLMPWKSISTIMPWKSINTTIPWKSINTIMPWGKLRYVPRGFGTAVLLFLPQGHLKNPPKLKWSCCTHVMYMISCAYNQLSVYYIINCSVAHCELVHIVLH